MQDEREKVKHISSMMSMSMQVGVSSVTCKSWEIEHKQRIVFQIRRAATWEHVVAKPQEGAVDVCIQC